MKSELNNTCSIMGILNITPNSFSDGGRYYSAESAMEHQSQLISSGAEIIDVGAESTGPNSKPISAQEEILRLGFVFDNVFSPDVKISVDTYKAQVAAWVLERGASIINDVSGLRADPEMVDVVANRNCDVVLMYSRESKRFPHASNEAKEYDSILDTILAFFEERINLALKRGIKESSIILDPGMGSFLSPNSKYSWDVVRSVKLFKQRFSSFRLLYAVSRKGFVRDLTKRENLDFASKLIELELIENGVDIIRTHNVALLREMLVVSNKFKIS